MNSSDAPLNDDEAMLTAYLDGRLDLASAAAFENAHPAVAGERAQLEKVRAFLTAERPVLRNGEFFNRQILREIAAPSSATESKVVAPPFFGLWRMLFAGACCMMAALGIYRSFVPERVVPPAYYAKVLDYKTGDEKLTARLVQEEGITVVMVDGLEPLEEEFILN